MELLWGHWRLVITERAHCLFFEYIWIALILLLWDLSTLCVINHFWPVSYIYIYIYIYISVYLYVYICLPSLVRYILIYCYDIKILKYIGKQKYNNLLSSTYLNCRKYLLCNKKLIGYKVRIFLLLSLHTLFIFSTFFSFLKGMARENVLRL